MKWIQISTKKNRVLVCTVLCMLSVAAVAGRSGRDDRENGRSQKEERKEQMRQEARTYAEGIDKALKAILEPTAKNQRPEENVVEGAQSALDQSKRYASVFDEKQKAQFMLLQAWTSFYQDNLPQALNWSMRAAKTNEASQDAWNSQALFCMLAGKRPMLPRMEQPKKRPDRPDRPNSRRRRNEEYETQTPSVKPYSEKGVLDFDLLGHRSELLKEQFGRLELVSAGGQSIEFMPQKNTLCIFFWQTDEALSDANDLAKGIGQVPPELEETVNFIEMEIAHSFESQKVTLQTQRDYIRKLKDACQESPEIQFVQVNTNQIAAATKAAETAVKDPEVEEAGALVFAADPASKAGEFVGLKAEKPFLAVVDTEGKVKYAGTASGFVPAFILTELTGVEIDLEKQAQQETPYEMGDPMDDEMMFMLEHEGRPAKPHAQTDPNKPVVDPNKPAADPNSFMPAKKPTPSQQTRDFPTQSMENQVQAEKLLQLADMEIGKSRKLRSNPKKGIEACREILAKYPNTVYAQQARELLRKVPERYQKMNNITDDELGY